MSWLKRLFGLGDDAQPESLVVSYTAKGPGQEVRSPGSIVNSPDGMPSGEEIKEALLKDLQENRGFNVDEIEIHSIRKNDRSNG